MCRIKKLSVQVKKTTRQDPNHAFILGTSVLMVVNTTFILYMLTIGPLIKSNPQNIFIDRILLYFRCKNCKNNFMQLLLLPP
jgi:hypothetical protein